MVSGDLDEIIKQIERDLLEPIREVALQIQQDMRVFWLESVYSSRSPHYDYTELLLNSARVSEPRKVGNEWIIEIYIDDKEMHSNPAWYNLEELGIEVGDAVSLFKVSERMDIIGRSENIMDTMKEKWLDNKQALDYILNKLRSKYDILG
jgi:hypothetical protein